MTPMNVFRFSPTTLLTMTALVVLTLSGCTKFAPYDGETFDCECGNLTWSGRDLGMRMAEVELLNETTYRYHVIADLRNLEERENREEPRDIVFTLTTELNGGSTSLSLAAGDATLDLQEVDSPGTGIDWNMDGAELSITATPETHIITLTSLSATRGANTITASGEFIFDLVD
jgi:hypothetical protein